MRELATAYRTGLSPAKKAEAERRAEARKESVTRKNNMLGNIISNFKAKFPEPEKGLEYILSTRAMPIKAAARVFLKALYGLSSDQVNALIPRKMKKKASKYNTGVEKEFLAELVKLAVKAEEVPKLEVVESKPPEVTKPATTKTTIVKKKK
jgi:hypothetical protein